MLIAGGVGWRTSMNSMIKSIKVWIESIRFSSSSSSPSCLVSSNVLRHNRPLLLPVIVLLSLLLDVLSSFSSSCFLRSIYVLCFFPRACDKGKFPCRNRTTWYRKRTKEKRVCISDFFRELRHKIRIMFRNIINEHKKGEREMDSCMGKEWFSFK